MTVSRLLKSSRTSAAGQATDTLQLLRLPELILQFDLFRFGALLFGNVPGYGSKQFFAIALQPVCSEQYPTQLSVFSAEPGIGYFFA